MKYCIITFGCQMNRSDSERIASVLESIGYQPAPHQDWRGADLIVVNMCSVRQSAVDRVWGQINRLAKLKACPVQSRRDLCGVKNDPEKKSKISNGARKLKVVLTGCILKEDKKKFQNKVDLILDIKDLPNLPDLLNAQNYETRPRNYLKIKPNYQSSFSAYVPIMTGCNNFCTFCAVPYTRGREICRPADEIICEIKNLIERGYKEIWLLGQNVNSYRVQRRTEAEQKGGTDAEINFAKLLKMVNDIPGNFWIRFTSPHPADFSDELIETMAMCEKVTPYLNLPVQSGDNEILKKMNRPYTVEQYKNLVKKIREAFAEIRGKFEQISISTDAIVGFPGETKKQFENTVKLFKEVKFDMAYIAQYSPRPDTAAAKLKDGVSQKEKERRWKILTEVLKETALEKNKKYLGKEIEVLIDGIKENYYFGKTRTYKTVKIQDTKYKIRNTNLISQFVKVKIINALPWGLKGELK